MAKRERASLRIFDLASARTRPIRDNQSDLTLGATRKQRKTGNINVDVAIVVKISFKSFKNI